MLNGEALVDLMRAVDGSATALRCLQSVESLSLTVRNFCLHSYYPDVFTPGHAALLLTA